MKIRRVFLAASAAILISVPAVVLAGPVPESFRGPVRQLTSENLSKPSNNRLQREPRISGDYIVWEDWRDQANQESECPRSKIWVYRISDASFPTGIRDTINQKGVNVLKNRPRDVPDIYGDYIVWNEWFWNPADDETCDDDARGAIYGYQVSSGARFVIQDDIYDDYVDPHIDSGGVVWANEDRGSILWKILPFGAISSVAFGGKEPDISGTTLVWVDPGPPADIWFRELGGGGLFPAAQTPAPDRTPTASGTGVLWSTVGAIHYKNGTGAPVQTLRTLQGKTHTLAASGDWYVYQDCHPDCELWVGNKVTGRHILLATPDPAAEVQEPVDADIDGNRVVWTRGGYIDMPNGDYNETGDIYYGVFNRPPVFNGGVANQTLPHIEAANITIPSAADPDGDPTTVTFVGSNPPTSAASYNPATRVLFIDWTIATGRYLFTLRAADTRGATQDLRFWVTVNAPPVAVAGLDRTIDRYASTQVNGCLSHDFDQQPQALTYQWKRLDTGAVLSTNCSATVSFGGTIGLVPLRLTVSDGADTDTDDLLVTILSDMPPELTFLVPAPKQRHDRNEFPVVFTMEDLGGGTFGANAVGIRYKHYLFTEGNGAYRKQGPAIEERFFKYNPQPHPSDPGCAGMGTDCAAYVGHIDLNPSVFDIPFYTEVRFEVTSMVNGAVNLAIRDFVVWPDGYVSPCHVLTAAFGNPDAPEIEALWALHGRLLPFEAQWHQRYMAWYEAHGPAFARAVDERPWLRALIRAVAKPIAFIAEWLNSLL